MYDGTENGGRRAKTALFGAPSPSARHPEPSLEWGLRPAAETRCRGPLLVPKRITPSRLQAPPGTAPETSQMVCGGPPEMASFLSWPLAMLPALIENATNRLSGDQKTGGGRLVGLSVPASGRTSTESSARSHMRVMPSAPVAGNITHRPSGETEGPPPVMNLNFSVG